MNKDLKPKYQQVLEKLYSDLKKGDLNPLVVALVSHDGLSFLHLGDSKKDTVIFASAISSIEPSTLGIQDFLLDRSFSPISVIKSAHKTLIIRNVSPHLKLAVLLSADVIPDGINVLLRNCYSDFEALEETLQGFDL